MMTPIWLGTSWKMNKPLSQAMAGAKRWQRECRGLSPCYSALRHSPSPRSNPSAIFCKRISYRF